jgi:hypothetical protein
MVNPGRLRLSVGGKKGSDSEKNHYSGFTAALSLSLPSWRL